MVEIKIIVAKENNNSIEFKEKERTNRDLMRVQQELYVIKLNLI